MNLVFDVGMYDGADSEYYLQCGLRVVAVEANQYLAASACKRFAQELQSGQFVCVNAAVTSDGGEVELTLSGKDLGSSSVFAERVVDQSPVGSLTVPGVTLAGLFETYGVPDYLKVDIEGADRLCVLALTPTQHPDYLSFEIGEDVEELLDHAASVGYRHFKVVNQVSFRELSRQRCLRDRLALRLMGAIGYRNPTQVRRGGRFFASGHSSGPLPWLGEGKWSSAEEVLSALSTERRRGRLSGWYDVHAWTG
ncbi:MAG: FkbM family methyltransferase [Actinobacteria bacterium]|nr:FkbM family methyltransferase [Actinomycetota bacterium]